MKVRVRQNTNIPQKQAQNSMRIYLYGVMFGIIYILSGVSLFLNISFIPLLGFLYLTLFFIVIMYETTFPFQKIISPTKMGSYSITQLVKKENTKNHQKYYKNEYIKKEYILTKNYDFYRNFII